jgi:hypothetical protein
MKRNLAFMLFIAVLLGACSKNQTSTTQTGSSTFPTKASDYIVNNYPDASVDYIISQTSSQARYIAVLNTTEELAFTQEGEFLGDGREFHHGDSIPGDTVHCDSMPGWHHGHHGHHGDEEHHWHHGHGGHGGFGIDPDSLPAAIVNFVNTNFPGSGIIHANYDSICPEGNVIAVMVGDWGTEPVKLFFDLTDTYLFKAKRIRYNNMPQAVRDSVAAGFAAYHVSEKGEKLTLPDSTLQFRVYLHQEEHIRKSVRLNADGTLVCVLE